MAEYDENVIVWEQYAASLVWSIQVANLDI